MNKNMNPYIDADRKLLFFQNYQNPCVSCPQCGGKAIRMVGIPFLFCEGDKKHQFYECPTCFDTRVSDIKENAYYCGLSHSYTLCPIHESPVAGVFNMTAYPRCICPKKAPGLIRQKQITQWDSPFL